MVEHFWDVEQKVMDDSNSESFAAHIAKHFTQKPSPQQFSHITYFKIPPMVSPIYSMKSGVNSLVHSTLNKG